MNNHFENHKIYAIPFEKIYEMYIQKIIRKNRTIIELNRVIQWLTNYNEQQIHQYKKLTMQCFF